MKNSTLKLMKNIKIYTTSYCPFCVAAKDFLKSKGMEFEEIDVENDPDLREKLSQELDYRTVPMIFIDGEFIGGFSELQGTINE